MSNIFEAIQKNDLSSVKEICENSPDIINARKNKISPLYFATMLGQGDIVKFLLEKYPNIMALEQRKHPFYVALEKPYYDIIRHFIDAKVDVNMESTDALGKRLYPLQIAEDKNDLDLYAILLKAGADASKVYKNNSNLWVERISQRGTNQSNNIQMAQL